MGRYDRYILSQLLVLFGFFSLVLISVDWINRAVDLFDSLIADGQNLAVFLEFTALSLPSIMLSVLPISAFVATLYIFNRMISESELVVLQTSGMGAIRLLRPVLAFGLVLTILISILAHVLAPAARNEFNERSIDVSQDLTGRLLREGEFIHPTAGLVVYIREITELGEFRDVFMQDRSAPEAETTYVARQALLVRGENGPRLVMFDGMAQTLALADQRLSIVEFDDFTYDIAALTAAPEVRHFAAAELSTPVLLRAEPGFAAEQGLTRRVMQVEGHSRIARALFVLLVPVIAAATLMLGTFSRFGVWPQILLAIGLIIPLQVTWNAAEAAALSSDGLIPLIYAQPALAVLITAGLVYCDMRARRPRRQVAA
ncbi:LPS export ABC transporter permease LptF [Rhodophyticola sp. CCM32]|uniref:LPS export ABC transporter permease LptF n=1 Tax=Rhodophyticola sp. CCM32 TaxID=2916397 RepID=UPI00107EFBA4|nr:LPS export ABC transporter permease LptF [Rhodophyticola sp. CCM32]QBX99978.1 LPS export ABC transporter permease LptF [Rhodophyticola sp. CCM32]